MINIFLIVTCIVFLLVILRFSLRSKLNKSIWSSVGASIVFVLFLAFALKLLSSYFLICLVAYLFYVVVTLAIKVFTVCILMGKKHISFSKEIIKEMFLFYFELLLLSPDYFITKIAKESNGGIKGVERADLIKLYNHINIVFSAVLAISLIVIINFNFFSFYLNGILAFCGYRFISRCVEITISFCDDVIECDKKPSSKLEPNDRILLAFLSIVEIIVLSFGIYFVYNNGNLANAALDSICFVVSSPSVGSNWKMVDAIKLFEDITCFCLLGIVLSSYIGGNKENNNAGVGKEDKNQ